MSLSMCALFASFKIARREKEVGEVEERERGNYQNGKKKAFKMLLNSNWVFTIKTFDKQLYET